MITILLMLAASGLCALESAWVLLLSAELLILRIARQAGLLTTYLAYASVLGVSFAGWPLNICASLPVMVKLAPSIWHWSLRLLNNLNSLAWSASAKVGWLTWLAYSRDSVATNLNTSYTSITLMCFMPHTEYLGLCHALFLLHSIATVSAISLTGSTVAASFLISVAVVEIGIWAYSLSPRLASEHPYRIRATTLLMVLPITGTYLLEIVAMLMLLSAGKVSMFTCLIMSSLVIKVNLSMPAWCMAGHTFSKVRFCKKVPNILLCTVAATWSIGLGLLTLTC